MGVPPTGKRVEVEFFDMVRVRDGRAREHWGVLDGMAMMQQLGAIPAEAPA
jgi:predicted ester cyclase